jgi:hypothetical protein
MYAYTGFNTLIENRKLQLEQAAIILYFSAEVPLLNELTQMRK